MEDLGFVRSELICFMQQKASILPFDDLVTIIADFYSSDEIAAAAGSVSSYAEHRIPSYKGTDKDRKIVADVLKLVLNPKVRLPTYVAVDISRLPPVSADHLDMSAILQELTLLRSEVRAIGAVRAELEELKSAMKVIKPQVEQLTKIGSDDGWNKRRSGHTSVQDGEIAAVDSSKMLVLGSFASKARDLSRTGLKQRASSRPVVGLSTNNEHIKSVETARTVDIFVSRLDPYTKSGELVDCVNAIKGDLNVLEINCTKLHSKYEHLYSSYHVSVKVTAMQFKSAIELLSSAEAWPMGIFVKRFFKPKTSVKNGSTEESA